MGRSVRRRGSPPACRHAYWLAQLVFYLTEGVATSWILNGEKARPPGVVSQLLQTLSPRSSVLLVLVLMVDDHLGTLRHFNGFTQCGVALIVVTIEIKIMARRTVVRSLCFINLSRHA